MSWIGVAIGAGVGLASSLIVPAATGKPITAEGVLIGTAGGALGGAAGTALAPAASAATGTAPAVATSAAPAATTSIAPAATTSIAPAATTSIAPAATTSIAPAATTGIAPAATTGIAPAATTGIAPAATTGIAPATTTGIAPATTTGIAPAATTTAAPAATTTVAPVGTGGITNTADDVTAAAIDEGANFTNPQATADAINAGIPDVNAIAEKAINPDNFIQQGMNAVKNAPHLSANVTGGMTGASLGAMVAPAAPGPKYKQTPTQNIYDPIPYTQEDIPKTTIPKYYQYATGGIIPPQPQQEVQPQQEAQSAKPMNKFAQMGLDMAKQIQAQNQPKQAAPQAGIPVPPAQMQPPMGIPQQASMQPQMGIPQQVPMQPQQNFADGGVAQNNTANPQDNFFKQVQTGIFDQLTAQMASQRAPGAQTAQSIEPVAPVTPIQPITAPTQNAAGGGIMRDNLGGYSHGGIAGLTRGPGDGVSDSIPAQIGNSGKQPARLADGEFVISSRIVSELGNGSTEAGAKALQAMVDRVQSKRQKSIGKGKVAVDSKARKELLG